MSALALELEAAWAGLGPVRRARFFGGEGFGLHGRQFAMLLKGTLYLRCDSALAAELEAAGSEPFRYRTRRGPVTVGAYWSAPAGALDDPEALLAWARKALAAARD